MRPGPLLVRHLAEQAAFLAPAEFAATLGASFVFVRLDEHDAQTPPPIAQHRPLAAEPAEDDEATKTLVSSRWIVPEGRGSASVYLVPTLPPPPATLVLGRSSSCEVHIGVRSVSRRHATLEWRAAGLTLRDVDAENGTWVNGHRVRKEPALLRPLDLVTLADVRLLFLDVKTLFEGLAVLSD